MAGWWRSAVIQAKALSSSPLLLAMPIAAAAYGKVPFADLAGAGLVVEGDAKAAWRFLDCFILPDKVG